MAHLKKKFNIFIVMMAVCGFFVFAGQESRVKEHLDRVEKEIDTAVKGWQFSQKGENWQKHWLRRGIDIEEFHLRANVSGKARFAGTKVAGSPLHLRLKLYARGYCEVAVQVDGKEAAAFTVDGSSGTGTTVEQTVPLAEKAATRDYRVVLKIKNKGFKPFRGEYWPPRKEAPEEEGLFFRLTAAEFIYPGAGTQLQEIKDWLASMKTADTLVNPDFRRFTFTGKPYDIPDKRKTPAAKLRDLEGTLNKAVLIFSLDALKKGDWGRLEASIQDSYRIAERLREYAKEFKVHLIGNAHIDIAWLWRIAETVMVAHNTYDTVIKNMDEYPELHYAQSQAVTYEWIEERYPELFENIKKKIKAGQWEVVGGMYVEPDCNLISGESWVRQILYGKNYFKEKFGIDVKTGWNVDSFGYNWNMPQLYRKSGIDRFVTQKIWWNDTTVFPYYIFWWQGVDGTKLLSYFPPVGYTSRVELDRVADNITKYEATTGFKKSLILYGIGDHGGGPNREILNRVRGYEKLHIAPDFIHSYSRPFLENLEAELGDSIPVWKDELYLEYHRGTYTTQAKVKKGNREGESRLSTAEKLASVNYLLGGTYPAENLEKAWKLVLTNQFHDILPGSHITPVAVDAREYYKKAGKKIKKVQRDALAGLAAKIDTRQIKKGIPLVVFNSLSWKRSDIVQLVYPGGEGEDWHILDNQGKSVPTEVTCDQEGDRLEIAFIARDIPALGYRLYSLVEGKPRENHTPVSAKGTTLENRFHRVKVNAETGNIAGIYDKLLGKEFVAGGKEANVLQIYEDRPENWDAWNIGYTGRMWELNKADSVEVLKSSPVRAVLRVKKSFLGLVKDRYSPTEEFPSSFFTQDITLYRDLDRIDIHNQADWWESHMFLKAAFPVNVSSDFAGYEIPFGTIHRTTKSGTLWEKARFEVPALRWADLSGQDNGITLLNDGKYGYDIHDGIMKLSLLRAPTWPDPVADRGKHNFTYSIYTHNGKWQDGFSVERGRELNAPLVVHITGRHKGTLPGEFSFFSLDSTGVVLDTVKMAESGEGLILRFYESRGNRAECKLKLFKAPARVIEVDLMENKTGDVQVSGREVNLALEKFEIKTLKVSWN